MEIPRRYWRNFDLPLLAAVIGLIAIGIVIIYSATYSRLLANGDDPLHYVKRQAIGALIGFVAMGAVLSVDYRALRRWSKILYILNIGLLSSVLIFGRTVYGSQRWLRFGPLSIQPSELAKIIVIIALARFLEKQENIREWRILIPFVLVAGPFLLILVQPDMGTAMIFVGLVFSLLYLGGANIKDLAAIGCTGFVAMLAAIYVSYKQWIPIIKPYQLTRLLVFLNPYADRNNAGWNVIQSMIAIGSGGFLGKGILSGSQNQLNFLPANHTDFVFSVIGEELGFVGALVVLALYVFIIWRGLRIACLAKDTFGQLLAAGCVALFFFHLAINVGMTVGMMPVTGLPLPFITYGGNTLLINLVAVGLILNVGLRRQKIMF